MLAEFLNNLDQNLSQFTTDSGHSSSREVLDKQDVAGGADLTVVHGGNTRRALKTMVQWWVMTAAVGYIACGVLGELVSR